MLSVRGAAGRRVSSGGGGGGGGRLRDGDGERRWGGGRWLCVG